MDQFVQRSPLSLSVSAAALLVMMGAPEVLIQLADYVAQNSPPSMSFRDLMHYDMFAGSRGMQRAYCRQGIRSDYMDMQHRADDDICTPIAARVCLLLLLLTSRRCFFMVEQPFSTKLVLLPYVKHVFEMISAMLPVRNVFFWMGNYGHFSCKGSRAFSNLTFIGRLTKKLSKSRRQRLNLSSDGVVTRRARRGKVAVTGSRLLKKTQEYPKKFCKKVLQLHVKSIEQNFNLIHRKLDCGPRLLLQKGKVTPPLAWQHADLEEIAEFLRGEQALGRYKPNL